jgi:hypothetical protein
VPVATAETAISAARMMVFMVVLLD